ncbi:helix-turn-helix domain-containing protein [Actinacidiphila epipremni]|uniref:Helix-turn-helix transcriptional regulator n=1 Tax=Actinacidiphila epipremni TaxID=2053013 RepID=A0ABX0ZSX2_9ACTN|nr:helix-turn-helix transcriptional regulator [Actinacidiphila epipremni]NJP44603.1 helix-turn-helix transcriptional regulator [Actinacidiphila epipremni]
MDEQAFNAAVGRNIRAARQRAELTQELLARQAGLSRGSITNMESGTQAPPPYRLARIAAALHVEPADLLPPLGPGSQVGDLPEHLAAEVASVLSAAKKMRVDDGQS